LLYLISSVVDVVAVVAVVAVADAIWKKGKPFYNDTTACDIINLLIMCMWKQDATPLGIIFKKREQKKEKL
jgi:hypothetical protein